MKRYTRISAVLLALLMLIGTMPLSAFASQPMETIALTTITSIELETDCASPAALGDKFYPDIVSVNGDTDLVDLISGRSYSWARSDTYSTDRDSYDEPLLTGIFQYDTAYDLQCDFDADPAAARFSPTCSVSLKTSNGTKSGVICGSHTDELASFDFFYEMNSGDDPRPVISSIELTTNIAKPVVGQPIYSPTLLSVNGNTANIGLIDDYSAYWWYCPTYSTDGDDYDPYRGKSFDRGWSYDMYINIYAPIKEAVISESCTLTLNTPSGKLQGQLYDFYADDNAIFFDIFFDLTGGLKVRRLYGDNRYETALSICREGWEESPGVVIASGENYPDALAGTVLAAKIDSPILLTSKDSIDADVLEQINDLTPEGIIILGGTSAVSQGIEDNLTNEGYEVMRLYGNNRNATAAAVSEALGLNDTAFIVSNQSFADALSAGSAAAIMGAPILYANADGSLPSETVEALQQMKCSKVYIIGGAAAVASDAESNLASLDLSVERIYGSDRQLTSIEVYKNFKELFVVPGAAIATGLNFPDALAGVAFTAKSRVPLFLVVNSAPTELHTILKGIGGESGIAVLAVFGGASVVPKSIIDDIEKKLLANNSGFGSEVDMFSFNSAINRRTIN